MEEFIITFIKRLFTGNALIIVNKMKCKITRQIKKSIVNMKNETRNKPIGSGKSRHKRRLGKKYKCGGKN